MRGEGKPASHVQTLILLSDCQKRGVKKGTAMHSSPNLAEVKKKGKMKKLSQAVEEDLIVGLQGLVRDAWLQFGLLYQTKQLFSPP